MADAEQATAENQHTNSEGSPQINAPDSPLAQQQRERYYANAAMQAATWKPGQSGNPHGRPKFRSFEEMVREVLAEPVGGGIDKFEALARVVVDEALIQRNTQVIKILTERLWPVSNVFELKPHREPPEVKPPRSLEHMREVLRIAAEVIDDDLDADGPAELPAP